MVGIVLRVDFRTVLGIVSALIVGIVVGDSLEGCRRDSFGVVFRGILEIFLRLVWRTVVGLVLKLWNVFGLVLRVVRRWS